MSKEIVIPSELKLDFFKTAYNSVHKGYLYAIREECGAATALKVYERLCKMGDRIKNLTNFFITTFKIEGNDCETIGKWWDIWNELMAQETIILERSKSINRARITKCPVKTDYDDISDWALIFCEIVNKTINPKAITERPKGMCAGDSYCEYVYKIEE